MFVSAAKRQTKREYLMNICNVIQRLFVRAEQRKRRRRKKQRDGECKRQGV